MQKFILNLMLVLSVNVLLTAQVERIDCSLAFNEVDEFDSTRVIASEPVAFGYFIPSRVETADGPKLVEEAKAMMMYSISDSISGFFLHIAVPEYEYQPIEKDFNVMVKLADGSIEALYNVPDKGVFDKSTNMRLYTHTVIVPIPIYNKMAEFPIEKIRIIYTKKRKTIELNKTQQDALLQAIRCVGQEAGYYPMRP